MNRRIRAAGIAVAALAGSGLTSARSRSSNSSTLRTCWNS